jgi:hypothetical protein
MVPRTPVGSSPWAVRHRTIGVTSGDDAGDSCLVGPSPTLEIADADPTPNAGYNKGVWRPFVLRSCLTLRAAAKNGATVSSASFHLDRGIMKALRPGDAIHMARTPCGGLGFSVVRGGHLVVALGAVTAVPLGDHVTAKLPMDLIDQARAVFQRRGATFDFPELPVELTSGDHTCIVPGGSPRLPGYRVTTHHGFYVGTPGIDECLAISCVGLCSDTAANASAVLLGVDGLQLVRWQDG